MERCVNDMKIVENRIELLDDFIRLNEAWISAYFEIEETDRKLAANPARILEDGGFVFSLVSGSQVLGVCALFNNGNKIFELARMAVSFEHQGKGYGNRLIEACLAKLKKLGAQKVWLASNDNLKPALALYKKHGFEVISKGRIPNYSRANIVMERIVG